MMSLEAEDVLSRGTYCSLLHQRESKMTVQVIQGLCLHGLQYSGYEPYPGFDHIQDIMFHTEKSNDLYPCKHDKYWYPSFYLLHLICAGGYDVYCLQHKLW